MKHKFSSVSNDTSAKRSHRGVGQAVAALVMALALTIGGAGTTILLVEQNANAALKVAEETGNPASAIELPGGEVVTGKTTDLMGASSATLLKRVENNTFE